jgi:DnaJ domain
MTTIYATLGVQPDATLDEIKRAYRRAAMKWHPDRNPGREAEAYAAFQEIREAYAILSDAEQRRVYDEVFAQEMQRWQAERDAQEAQEREAQRERERLAQEHYEKMVAIAMRFADEGHHRDVLFGVLLGRACGPCKKHGAPPSLQRRCPTRSQRPHPKTRPPTSTNLQCRGVRSSRSGRGCLVCAPRNLLAGPLTADHWMQVRLAPRAGAPRLCSTSVRTPSS